MTTQDLNEIHTMINQDLATSRQLLALLEQEIDSTKSRDYEKMGQLLKEKTPLLEQLKQNAQTRSQWLISLNRSSNETSWAALLESFNDENLQKQWQEVKTTVEHCQKINEDNGKLVNRGVNSHQRLLQIMRGNIQQADIYNAKGSKQSSHFGGTVTQA